MPLQPLAFSSDQVAVVHAFNTAAATTLSGLMHAAKGATVPAPPSIDPVSHGLSAAFARYQGGFFRSTSDGIDKFHDGNAKLPEAISRYDFGDASGGARVQAADTFSA